MLKKRMIIIFSLVGLILVTALGTSYAYMRINRVQSDSNVISTLSCLEVQVANGRNAINLTNAYPMSDLDGKSTRPYTFTLTNNCGKYVELKIGFEVASTSTLPANYLNVSLVHEDEEPNNYALLSTFTLGTALNGGTAYILSDDKLYGNESKTYDFRMWIPYNLTASDIDDLTLSGNIILTATVKTPTPDGYMDAPESSLLGAIRKNSGMPGTPKTIPGVEPAASGPVTETYTEICGGNSDCTVTYYDSQINMLSDTNGTSGNLGTVYASLVNKWVVIDGTSIGYVTEATATDVTYHNNDRVFTKEKNLLLSTQDDYGTSFYFRGEVDNNFVAYGGMCWRIVRIDGAGNARLVLYNYNPTDATNPCDSSLDGPTMAFARVNDSYQSAFNTTDTYNTHVGYMYSNNPINSNILISHANNVNSTILTKLNSWVTEANLTLDDAIWCNDKRIITDTNYNLDSSVSATGLGYDNNKTYYMANMRLRPYDSVSGTYSTVGASPSLKCGDDINDNKISKFTSLDETYGNAALPISIGLLTADEAAFAGLTLVGTNNNCSYLLDNAEAAFWTMTPNGFKPGAGTNASEFIVTHGVIASMGVFGDAAIRPVIALDATTTSCTGVGTQSDPYVLSIPQNL